MSRILGLFQMRLPYLLSCVVVAIAAGACLGESRTVVDGDYIFVNVNVVPMDQERIIENQIVAINGSRITSIGDSGQFIPAESASVIESAGQFLVPGFTEMHGHLPSGRMSDEDIRNLLFLYIANGVTTVRGMQGEPSQLALRNSIQRGLLLGPNLYLASESMSGERVPTPEEAVRLVREHKVDGYDLIKTHEGISLETFDAIARTAVEMDMPFGGHVSDLVGLQHALESGQSSVDHLDNYVEALAGDLARSHVGDATPDIKSLISEIDERRIPELVQVTVDSGSWVVPTMVLWESAFFPLRSSEELLGEHPELRYIAPEVVDQWRRAIDTRFELSDVQVNQRITALRRKILRALHSGGANIALGTDSPQIFSVPGFSIHHEMSLYAEIGMTPYQILELGTRRPSEYFGATDDFGTVEVGKRADLLLLAENPLEDVMNLKSRVGVMIGGRWLPTNEIDLRLESIARFYGNE